LTRPQRSTHHAERPHRAVEPEGDTMTMPTTFRAKWLAGVAATAIAALSLSGCGSLNESSSDATGGPCKDVKAGSVDPKALKGVTVKVGSKEFDEQLILGQLTVKMMCAAGAKVVDRTNTKGSTQTRKKLQDGVTDVVWEYTGTGWINYLGHTKPIKGSQAQYEAVRKADLKNGLTWLPPAPMNNTYAFAIRESKAKQLDITKLSQLKTLPKKELTFCVESEFAKRNDGFQPMLKTYGLSNAKIAKATNLDTGVIYTATADGGTCNFGEVFTTDGRIPGLHLRVLQDDKAFFPLYNVTEVVQTSVLKKYPALGEIFAKINPKLTNKTMLTLNAKVDVAGGDPAIVAKDWLVKEGFVTD
jgi:osmoprotectant transport system substrate-binding protein